MTASSETRVDLPADTDSACLVGRPTSVEARFGLHSCNPRGSDSHTDMQLGDWATDGRGQVQAGVLGLLADHTLGEVPYLRRPAGTWSVTTELAIDFVRPVQPGEALHAWATPTRMEQGNMLVRGAVTDASDSTVALATTRCVYVRAQQTSPQATAAVRPGTDRSADSIVEHLGLMETEPGVHDIEFRLDDVTGWVNDFDILHGGIWACMSEIAGSRAIAERNPALRTAALRTVYLRSGMPGAGVTVSARVIHVGGRFAVAEVNGRTDDGQLCTLSTVTARRVEELGPGGGR